MVAWKDEPVYAYFDEHNPQTGFAAYHYLEDYLLDEGRYDGVIAFSQAGTMILTYLIHLAKRDPQAEMPFKFAIILSITHPPLDYEALQKGRVMTVDLEATKGIIPIPTAHIWGSLDEPASRVATSNSVCKAEVRWVYVHGRGHEVPGGGSMEDVTQAVNVIRRAVETASNH